jgi:hypothetical protein
MASSYSFSPEVLSNPLKFKRGPVIRVRRSWPGNECKFSGAQRIRNILNAQIKNHNTVGSVVLFSIRHDFPTEWAKFQATSSLSIELTAELYPFWSLGRNIALTSVELFAEMSAAKTTVSVTDKNGTSDTLAADPAMGGLLVGNLTNLPAAITDNTHPPLSLTFDSNAMNDLWIAITWKG